MEDQNSWRPKKVQGTKGNEWKALVASPKLFNEPYLNTFMPDVVIVTLAQVCSTKVLTFLHSCLKVFLLTLKLRNAHSIMKSE